MYKFLLYYFFLLNVANVALRRQRGQSTKKSHLADVGREKDPHELVLALEVTGHQGEGGGRLRAIPLLGDRRPAPNMLLHVITFQCHA